MRMPDRWVDWLFWRLLLRVACARNPDFIVGEGSPDGAYLRRWFLTPWRRWQTRLGDRARASGRSLHRWQAAAARLLPNLYLHCFLRDDDDRALHDHPSAAVSLILDRGYVEHTIDAGGIHRRAFHPAGSLRVLRARRAHRVELLRDGAGRPLPCWTLFLFGPTVREWGFHCPQRGWVHWRDFTADGQPGEVGRGCE